jgi:membrane-associated protease RseP (regulator of RpoE activity)
MAIATLGYYLLALFGFGFVIFIHELGHYVFAKWAGVRVEVFSIGFGPKLWRRTIGETEYALSLLPFGGYVKMLGQDDNPAADQPDPDERPDPRSFLAKGPGWRALILLGGVLFNFVSSYAILLGLAFAGMPVERPLVGEVGPVVIDQNGLRVPTPADRLGLRMGDRVLGIDGHDVRSFDDVFTETVINARSPLRLEVQRRNEAQPRHLPESGADIRPVYSSGLGLPVIGIERPFGDRIRVVRAAHKDPSNPEPGERVVGIADDDISGDFFSALTGQEIAQRLQPWIGRRVRLTLVKDGGARRTVEPIYAGDALEPSYPGFPTVIDEVLPGQPGEKAGVLAGDILLQVNDTAVTDYVLAPTLIRRALAGGQPVRLELWREGAGTDGRLSLTVPGAAVEGGRMQIGVVPRPLKRGWLPALPTLVGGGDSPLVAAHVAPGDTVVDPDADRAENAPASLAVLSSGHRVVVPISDAALEAMLKVDPVPTIARWFGQKPEKSLIDQLLGAKVAAIDDGSGAAGGIAPGFARLTPATGGGTRDVDLRPLKALAPQLLGGARPGSGDRCLQVGDWIVGIASIPRSDNPQGRHGIEILRGAEGPPRTVSYDPGVAIAFDIQEYPYPLSSSAEAFSLVNTTSYNMVVKSLQLIPRFFRSPEQGGIDPNKSLTGPVGMFKLLKVRAEQFGLKSYLKFLALIGLNLFLVNMLPIPITDGGQLMILGVETAIRRPLPVRLRNLLQWIGLILVVGLMLYVLGLDLSRW